MIAIQLNNPTQTEAVVNVQTNRQSLPIVCELYTNTSISKTVFEQTVEVCSDKTIKIPIPPHTFMIKVQYENTIIYHPENMQHNFMREDKNLFLCMNYCTQLSLNTVKLDNIKPLLNEYVYRQQFGPHRASRALAMTHIAMMESLNIYTGFYTSYLNFTRVINTNKYLPILTMLQSTIEMLSHLYPSHTASLNAKLESILQSIKIPNDILTLSKILSEKICSMIIKLRSTDNSNYVEKKTSTSTTSTTFTCSTDPGKWRSDPLTGSSKLALGSEWSKVTPFSIPNVELFNVPPPPELDSVQYMNEYNELLLYGGDGIITPTYRTDDETQIALYWSYDNTNPILLYAQIALHLLYTQNIQVHYLLYVLTTLHIGFVDSTIACWYTKYKYQSWRPICAIRESDEGTGVSKKGDKNAYTFCDSNFTPLGINDLHYSPPFPGYTSGHTIFGSVLFEMCRNLFKTDSIPFTFTSDEYNGTIRPFLPRSYKNLLQAEIENFKSRVFMGVHFSSDEYGALVQGRCIAHYILNNVYKPVASSIHYPIIYCYPTGFHNTYWKHIKCPYEKLIPSPLKIMFTSNFNFNTVICFSYELVNLNFTKTYGTIYLPLKSDNNIPPFGSIFNPESNDRLITNIVTLSAAELQHTIGNVAKFFYICYQYDDANNFKAIDGGGIDVNTLMSLPINLSYKLNPSFTKTLLSFNNTFLKTLQTDSTRFVPTNTQCSSLLPLSESNLSLQCNFSFPSNSNDLFCIVFYNCINMITNDTGIIYYPPQVAGQQLPMGLSYSISAASTPTTRSLFLPYIDLSTNNKNNLCILQYLCYEKIGPNNYQLFSWLLSKNANNTTNLNFTVNRKLGFLDKQLEPLHKLVLNDLNKNVGGDNGTVNITLKNDNNFDITNLDCQFYQFVSDQDSDGRPGYLVAQYDVFEKGATTSIAVNHYQADKSKITYRINGTDITLLGTATPSYPPSNVFYPPQNESPSGQLSINLPLTYPPSTTFSTIPDTILKTINPGIVDELTHPTVCYQNVFKIKFDLVTLSNRTNNSITIFMGSSGPNFSYHFYTINAPTPNTIYAPIYLQKYYKNLYITNDYDINSYNSIDTSLRLNCDDTIQLYSLLDDKTPDKIAQVGYNIINNQVDEFCEHKNICNVRFINIPNMDISIDVFLNEHMAITLFQIPDEQFYSIFYPFLLTKNRKYSMKISVNNTRTNYELNVPDECIYLYDLSQLKL